MDLENQNNSNNQADLQGNIQLLDNEQPQGISSSQFNKQQAAKNTLNESISETIMRDLRMIAHKLKYVLLPKMRQDKGQELKDWDLWGPLLLCITLAITLSLASSEQAETVFAIIFVVIWIGAGIVTLNAKLLGGKISFFQSVCVLGYCVFPINISSFIVIFLPTTNFLLFLIKMFFCAVGLAWSTKASIPFMAVLVSEEKKLLAVYPVLLFYLFLSWFALIA
ncbi:hypothetical protein IMG5_181510 [Ichthyophthirius multifiliis]|uniref:Protein YIPF n=1 Tax=Ichthyophthirius multifiliis TaxID=5932 RepID=G0R2V0_ICHMU|nr:hypothetical protein IMG5_181510 [Ichthyophthirius multifiliis]EGR28222.1 hypothetical protein IMG5_181510 [Ichthyophthirius multifiliis]|eukprot:XP_004027567.1 hypothetical protein IMG5_181510 [Ichthyophthirius multifiliis]